uniref:FecR family protein n=1 Tax=uncultured Draconibacterium sp. TaxID=1573823 RepID=UPI003216DAE8
MKEGIDYWLIWKSYNHELTPTEEAELNDWLESDSRHLEYFDKFKSRKVESINDLYSQIDSNQDFKRVISLSKQRHFSFFRVGMVAASILFVFTLGYFGWEWSQNEQPSVCMEEISFDPGVKKATLVLNDGHEIQLDESKDTLIKESNILIRNTNSSLNYTLSKEKENLGKFNKLIVPMGGEYYLELSDGTKVWINSESVLKYPVGFSRKERKVELIGEAYFEVKSDSLAPFIVVSGDQRIKVLGTSFNVKAYNDELYIETSLVEGKVQLCTSSDKSITHELTPGYQGIFEKGTEDFKIRKVNLQPYISWKDGRFYFRKMSLLEISIILSRWYDVDFEFNDQSLESLRFNGNLPRYDNIQPILNQLSKTNEITFYAYGKTIYVE